MKISPDCDYYTFNRNDEFAPKSGECEVCYRYETCIKAFMKDKKPIPLSELPKFKGKTVWVQTPGIPQYGREGVVEDVNVDRCILWLVNDFTCHEYGKTWVAYPIEGTLPTSYIP